MVEKIKMNTYAEERSFKSLAGCLSNLDNVYNVLAWGGRAYTQRGSPGIEELFPPVADKSRVWRLCTRFDHSIKPSGINSARV